MTIQNLNFKLSKNFRIFLGWGRQTKNGSHSEILMQLQVPVIDTKDCHALHLRAGANRTLVNSRIGDHVICAGGFPGEGTWKGDSGGPLMIPIHENGTFPFYQIGIISCSIGCARESVPSVFTKIQYFGKWIEDKIKLL